MVGPVFFDTRALTANQLIDVVNARSWLYRRLPWPALIAIAANMTGAAGSVGLTVILGSDTQIGPDMPVPAGGTAGVFPDQSQSFSELQGAAGDLVVVQYREQAGATPTVNTILRLQPLI